MASFETLLGSALTDKDGAKVDTKTKLADCEVVALYFSAHWCPPCKAFTPIFAETYKKIQADGKKFEVIFVSSDSDEDSFNEYFKEMPWLALPYTERELKEKLGKKYKVRGIPAVVLLDKDANTITTNGRVKIAKDPEGFPWPKKTLKQMMGEIEYFDGANNSKVARKDAFDGKHTALYFSAHWCPPCKAFTPKFAETYKKIQADGKKFEVIFVSSDSDEDSFNEYFKEMPWLALPYTERKMKETLSEHFGVKGIPSLVILDPEFNVLNDDAVGSVQKDSTGERFPWTPPLVPSIDEAGFINDTATIISMVDGCDDEATIKTTEEALNKVAEKARSNFTEQGIEDKVRFAIAKSTDSLASRLREFTKLGAAGKDKVDLVLVNFGDQNFHPVDTSQTKPDVEGLTKLMEDFMSDKLDMTRL